MAKATNEVTQSVLRWVI